MTTRGGKVGEVDRGRRRSRGEYETRRGEERMRKGKVEKRSGGVETERRRGVERCGEEVRRR